ncbi:MAG: hypothetical protein HFI85_03330 [Clostridia bacterium]|jgi:hypothetical protein|nr:hypothetical protein [Clostridia bacterium]
MIQFLLAAEQWVGNYSWLNDVYKTLPNILYAILAAVGGAGMVYSIVLGVNLAKSENDEKRRYAAYRIRNTLIGVACLIVLVLFINLGLPALIKAIDPNSYGDPDKLLNVPDEDDSESTASIIQNLKLMAQPLKLLFI